MPTSNVSIGYRPARIAFLIKEGSIIDFIQCCKINTILWGGIFNPIVPVGTNLAPAQDLIESFQVDILMPISIDPQIELLIKNNKHLAQTSRSSKDLFYEDWRTKKKQVSYVDVLHSIDHFWEKDFKYFKEEENSICRYLTWPENDPLSNLFITMFGIYPNDLGLKENYEQAFKNGLRAKEVQITDTIDSALIHTISPIDFTRSRLTSHKMRGEDDGIFVGDGASLIDLLLFWNLRATGSDVIFLPMEHIDRFRDLTQRFFEHLDKKPSRHPEFEDWIHIYYKNQDNQKAVGEIIGQFKSNKKIAYACVYEEKLGFMHFSSTPFQFKSQSVSAHIEKDAGRYSVSIPLPQKNPFSQERLFNQEYVTLCKVSGDYYYSGCTLNLPFFPDLNEFFGRQVLITNPFSLRIQQDGTIAFLEHSNHVSIKLYPVAISDLMLKIFERSGIQAEYSQPGRLLNLIANKMGGVDGCRVFKIKGVRKLLKEVNEGTPWTEARKRIFNENFSKHYNLYIEARKHKKLSVNNVLHHLLRKDVLKIVPTWWYKVNSMILRIKEDFSCTHCGYKSRISVLEFEDLWTCPFCKFEHYLPIFMDQKLVKDRKKWLIKRSGLFSKDNNQEGAIPVLLTLMQLERIIGHHSGSKWCSSLNLRIKNYPPCEIDFAYFDLGLRFDMQEPSIAIGECKEGEDEIDDTDITNLCRVKELFDASGIKCYLVFSKTSDTFRDTEIERFKKLSKEKRIVPILFTNTELEPYEPYWGHPKESSLPKKYALSFDEMAWNSQAIYLEPSINDQIVQG